MPTYLVTWEIDIDADSPREAAEKALAIQRNPESTATVFQVLENDTETIDPVSDEEEDEAP
jgi:hypothetical protein